MDSFANPKWTISPGDDLRLVERKRKEASQEAAKLKGISPFDSFPRAGGLRSL